MHYARPARPVAVERAGLAWSLALCCWFAGSVLGQLGGGPAAVALRYPYARLQSGPSALVLFALCVVFLASLVLAMREGARWSRPALVVLAVPLAVLLVWQFGRSALVGTPGPASVAQAVCCVVAIAALPVAVRLMYRPDVGEFFTTR